MDNEYLQSLYTPEQQLLLFGDANYFNNQNNNNLPFSVGDRLFKQFNNAGAVPNVATQPFERFLNVPRGSETISPGTGIPGVLEPGGDFRTIPGYIDRNTNIYRGDAASSKGIMDLKPLGFDTSFGVANEEDVEQEFLPDQKSGIAKLFEFLQKFSPIKALQGLGSMLDFKDSPRYMPATMSVYGYTPEELNKMNALGGYYSEPMRAYRRNVNRISNLMQRAAAGKNYSQKNLDKLMNQVGMGNVDTRGMIDSIKASADMGYGKGDVGGGDTGLGVGGGRDYSSSPGAMAGDMEYGEE